MKIRSFKYLKETWRSTNIVLSWVFLGVFYTMTLLATVQAEKAIWSTGSLHPSPVSHAMPEGDFVNLWTAGHLVRTGRVQLALFLRSVPGMEDQSIRRIASLKRLDLSSYSLVYRSSAIFSTSGLCFSSVGYRNVGNSCSFTTPRTSTMDNLDCRLGWAGNMAIPDPWPVWRDHRCSGCRRPTARAALSDPRRHYAWNIDHQTAARRDRSNCVACRPKLAGNCGRRHDLRYHGHGDHSMAWPYSLGVVFHPIKCHGAANPRSIAATTYYKHRGLGFLDAPHHGLRHCFIVYRAFYLCDRSYRFGVSSVADTRRQSYDANELHRLPVTYDYAVWLYF